MAFFNKNKGLTKGKKKEEDIYGEDQQYSFSQMIMGNDGVNICAKACSVCWDTKLPTEYEERAKYIGKRTKIGHTSVIEHSNVVFYYEVNTKYYSDMLEFMSSNKYLNTVFKESQLNHDLCYLIVGGSWRAFADIYRVNSNIHNNHIIRRITADVYKYIPSEAMNDIIEAGILDRSSFTDATRSSTFAGFNLYSNTTYAINDNIDCINCDSMVELIDELVGVCPEAHLFSYYDLLNFVTVTINFKGLTRAATHQLVRHRNGITQESQRYVDYSKGMFTSPTKYKQDRYDEKKKYPIVIGSHTFQVNLQELGDMITSVYGQLINKTKLGNDALQYEDARAYLPTNIQCNNIYITFTWKNLISFLYLREDKHAQAELRSYATAIGEWFRGLEHADDTIKGYDYVTVPNVNLTNTPVEVPGTIAYNRLGEEIIETYEEHIENYDILKEDVLEEDTTESKLNHGEY